MLAAATRRNPAPPLGVWKFLTRRRVVLVSLLLIASYLTFWLAWLLILAGVWPVPPESFPKIDFFAFLSASSLSLDGAASSAYDAEKIWREQMLLPGNDSGYHPWRNPPIFFFFVLPLSLLPVALSLIAWSAATGGLLLTAVRRISEHEMVPMLALAFPATLWNLIIGQNGFLTAGLLAWGVLLLRDRPMLAGVALGLMAYKPQFFPLVLVALIAGGHRTSAVSAVLCVGVLSLASVPLFGLDSWDGFLSVVRASGDSIYGGGIELAKVQSVSAVILVMGLPALVAQAAQVAVAFVAVAFVAWLWRRDAPIAYKGAGLALGILMATPYVYHYDLTLLGIALLWLGAQIQKEGWSGGDAEVMVLAWLTPLSYPVLGFSIAPPVTLLLLAVLLRRVTSQQTSRLAESHLEPLERQPEFRIR